jgi:hypothetical protein
MIGGMEMVRRAGRRLSAATVALALMLSACGGPQVKRDARVSPPPRPPSQTLRQCLAKLSSIDVRYSQLPDRSYGGGCTSYDSVKLLDIGVPATNLGAMTCPLASNFAAWARYGVEPAARLILGSEIVRIETFGTYACRPIAGSAKLSEHAHSNAVDVAAFVLADGRRISVKTGWNGDGQSQKFLRIVRESACKRFATVLSPDYNAAHHDHLHFDMGGKGGYCR